MRNYRLQQISQKTKTKTNIKTLEGVMLMKFEVCITKVPQSEPMISIKWGADINTLFIVCSRNPEFVLSEIIESVVQKMVDGLVKTQ